MRSASTQPSEDFSIKRASPRRIHFAICAIIFLIAFSVRVLSWHDTRLEVGKVQAVVVENYKHLAQLIRQEGVRGFFSSSSPLADTNHLGHPPGYSILLSTIRSGLGESDAPAQFLQIFIDALSAVLIFLIVAEVLSAVPGIIAGLMAAFSPQLAWNSVLLLPDSLSVFPILLAVYLLAISRKHPRLLIFVAVGALAGISCWLRANALLMTVFFAAAVPLLNRNKLWWGNTLAVIFGTLLIVLPLTVRNGIVFHRFIPLSLGAGQTLLEGIADYDDAGRFNVPKTDLGIMRQEAEAFQRPDYKNGLLSPDGIQRERWRLQRGFRIIGSHPVWFASVMMQRAVSMMKLERARLLSTNPSVTHPVHLVDESNVVWSLKPSDLAPPGASGSAQARTSIAADGHTHTLTGDNSRYGTWLILPPANVRAKTDYVFLVPIRIEQGRLRISVTEANGNVPYSAIIEPAEGAKVEELVFNRVELPFVANQIGPVWLVMSYEASPVRPMIQVGDAKLYELGPARFLWTYYPRLLIRGIQKLFLTAIILPLAVFGIAILIVKKRRAVLIVLSVVPLYYFCVQSIFHTEYRYVLAVNHFLFALSAVAVCWTGNLIAGKLRSGNQHKGELRDPVATAPVSDSAQAPVQSVR